MTMRNKIEIIILVVLCIGSFILGWNLKKCTSIVSTVVKTNKIYKYVDVPSTPSLISYPVNKYFHDSTHSESIHLMYIDSSKYHQGFTSIDTLRYDSLYVAISDTGNCNGIIKRGHVFGGKQKIQVVTNETTKVTKEPIPLFSLYCGIQTTLGGRWNALDVGPSIQFSLKQKYNIGYSFQLNSRQHSVTLQTRIK